MPAQDAIGSDVQKDQASGRLLPIGAEPRPGGTHFRLWAPKCKAVDLVIDEGSRFSMNRESDGHYAVFAPGIEAGARYRFRLDGSTDLYPDPASRFQPDGVHGSSQVIDPNAFPWTDSTWRGRGPAGQVVYEMHIGTFTQEGTWAAATAKLPALADIGINCLEVMPVCDFAGSFGWGYDGVCFFAPTRLYGHPDEMRKFVDEAHRLGLAVILDVVYNHFGPDGNYFKHFADEYFTEKHKTDWGEAINFDDAGSAQVREFFLTNVRYWLTEFHLDGYRFDATQAIADDSPEHILAAISRTARKVAADAGREIFLVNENEPQHTRIVRPIDRGGYGMDALWNDDFHHSATVALSGHNEAYYTDHPGLPQEFVSTAKWGYLFQGQRYSWQKKRRGTPALDLPPTAFVNFTQNHDQIANSGRGFRVHHIAAPGAHRAMTALLLLMPQTPMLFQGQEWNASSTFHYFADHHSELAKLVRLGRAKELTQFPSVGTPQMQACMLNPDDPSVFKRSKLNWDERKESFHVQALSLHKDLLTLRREDPAFRVSRRRGDVDGAVLSDRAFVLRYFGDDGDDRLICTNFGRDLKLEVAPEPLLAPPLDKRWKMIWSSDDPPYGGCGTPPPETENEGWLLPGLCTVVLKAVDAASGTTETRVVKKD